MGLLSIGMAIISAVGICSVMGVSYGPVHTSLPFLMMGLGVDDIFVMMACWRQTQVKHSGRSIPEQMALMLQHAGASITVTSFTDVVAFAIGASTVRSFNFVFHLKFKISRINIVIQVLPSLQSFCIYAAVGVFFTYLLCLTFVMAVFALDERRINENRHPIFPCIVRKDRDRRPVCDANIGNRTLKTAFKVILTKPGKVIIVDSMHRKKNSQDFRLIF